MPAELQAFSQTTNLLLRHEHPASSWRRGWAKSGTDNHRVQGFQPAKEQNKEVAAWNTLSFIRADSANSVARFVIPCRQQPDNDFLRSWFNPLHIQPQSDLAKTHEHKPIAGYQQPIAGGGWPDGARAGGAKEPYESEAEDQQHHR